MKLSNETIELIKQYIKEEEEIKKLLKISRANRSICYSPSWEDLENSKLIHQKTKDLMVNSILNDFL